MSVLPWVFSEWGLIRNLRCFEVSDEDVLEQVCTTGSNLESVFLYVTENFWASEKDQLQLAVSTFKRIVHAVHSHPKLESLECTRGVHMSKMYDEVRRLHNACEIDE